jgi:hypothetical protein
MSRASLAVVLLLVVSGCASEEAGLTAAPEARALSPASATLGEWSAVKPWPVTPLHALLLPDGRVLGWGGQNTWDSTYQDAAIWDPSDDSFLKVPSTLVNIFCSGHTMLPDGRLLVTGGHLPGGPGKSDITIFDPASNSWNPSGKMYDGRWYPTNVTLGNGDVAILAGLNKVGKDNPIPEVWSPSGVRKLTKASRTIFFYPWLYLAPDGRVFHAGPNQSARWLNTTGQGQWIAGPLSLFPLRNQGTSVMYELGKIMIMGGAAIPTNTVERINLLGNARWVRAANMNYARRQATATVLADGKVFVVGGSNLSGFNNVAGSVKVPELWDPATNSWTTLAPHAQNRLYHSVAMLLPDARVMVGAGTDDPQGESAADHPDVEIFSPPYLFLPDGSPAPRPTITSAPAQATWGQAITIATPDSASIAKVHITRLAAITHTFSQDNRFLKLSFSGTPGGISVPIPSNPNHLPPGWYMIFLVDGAGVPSMGSIIRIS